MKRIMQMSALKNFSFYIVLDRSGKVVARIAVYFGPSLVQIDVDDAVTGLAQVTSGTLSVAWGKLEINGVKLYDGSVSDFHTAQMEKRYVKALENKRNPEWELKTRGMHLAGDGSGRVYYIAGLDRLTAKGYKVISV